MLNGEFMDLEKVLIMGAGHQGLAMAAHLSSNNVECYLWNRTINNISEIIDKREISCRGILCGKIPVYKTSNNIEELLQKTIMVATPSTAHKDIAKILAKYVDEHYTIILNPGRTFGILEFAKTLIENGCKSLPLLAETQSILYTCRRDSCNGVEIFALKNGVKISSFNFNDTNKIIQKIPKCIRSYFVPASSYLETSFGNVGMVLHCAPVLMNIGWIENKVTNFEYYYDGISESIAKVLEKIDIERLNVANAMGCSLESLADWLRRVYNLEGKNLYELLQNNKYYQGIDAPKSIDHRYINEDVPNGLVPVEAVGQLYNVQTPVTSLIINLANMVMDTDYRKIGRNAELLKIQK